MQELLKGLVIDIGCGDHKVVPEAVGLDISCPHADIQCPANDLPFSDDSVDVVFSAHCLEHIENDWEALREWWRVLKPGGRIILYLPHRDVFPIEANPDHRHRYIGEDIHYMLARMQGSNMGYYPVEITDCLEGDEYSFLVVAQKP